MASLRPEDLNLSALPRNRRGQLKEDALAELLQRAAWDYREVLAERQRLARTVEELTQRVDELTQQLAALEQDASRHKSPDELARVLLFSAQRAAREEREAARQESVLMLKKAARRAARLETETARLRSLRAEAERQVAEIAQSTLEKLESLGLAGGAQDELLGDLKLP
jgi:cell division septum initiation protein DivIVA